MLQSRVLKSILFVLSCAVCLAAAQDINDAVTSDKVEQEAVNTPSQSVVVDDALIEVTSALPLVTSTKLKPISTVALIASTTPTSDVLSHKTTSEDSNELLSSTSSSASVGSSSASNHVHSTDTHDISSTTSVLSSTSAAGSNHQDLETTTSSAIIASSPATNLVTTEAPIIAAEVTSIITSLATKPTTQPKPSAPNVLAERVEVLSIRPAGNCTTASNAGLNKLLREARQLLPLERLRNILITAIVNDTAVQNLRTLLGSEDFRAKVARLHAVSEYAPLNEYACQKLQLDYGLYMEFVRLIMGVRLELNQTETNIAPITNPRPGVRGLFQDLREALPREQLRALNRRLMLTDRELITAVRRILSSEFRRLLRAYRQRSEYREVFGALEKAGAPARPVQQLIATALGWSSLLDLGAETTLINV